MAINCDNCNSLIESKTKNNCNKCFTVHYCNHQCQIDHYDQHIKNCNKHFIYNYINLVIKLQINSKINELVKSWSISKKYIPLPINQCFEVKMIAQRECIQSSSKMVGTFGISTCICLVAHYKNHAFIAHMDAYTLNPLDQLKEFIYQHSIPSHKTNISLFTSRINITRGIFMSEILFKLLSMDINIVRLFTSNTNNTCYVVIIDPCTGNIYLSDNGEEDYCSKWDINMGLMKQHDNIVLGKKTPLFVREL